MTSTPDGPPSVTTDAAGVRPGSVPPALPMSGAVPTRSPEPLPAPPQHPGTPLGAEPTAGHRPGRRARLVARVAVVLLVLLLAGVGVLAAHLYRTSTAWQQRSEEYLQDARRLGTDLARTRQELSGSQAELDAVRAQLATAQSRIVALADEKAQIGDDREVQRQLVDYQQRVSDAAGQVALALDQCVQGQQELIGYLQQTVTGTAQYDAADLERFRTDVQGLCEAATEANSALQRELAR